MIPDPAAQPKSNAIRRWIVAIYAILALAAFAFPTGLREWLEERNASGRLWLPLAVARELEAASQAVGVSQVGEGLRQRFQRLIGDDKEP